MLIRALVILLLVLNVGVASWWALASGSESSAPTGVLPGVEPLQLVTGTVEPAATTPPRDAPVAPKIVQCGSFGGFDKASAAVAAGKQDLDRAPPHHVEFLVHGRQRRPEGAGPTAARGFFDAPRAGDLFLDTSAFGDGIAWLNGFCLGRHRGGPLRRRGQPRAHRFLRGRTGQARTVRVESPEVPGRAHPRRRIVPHRGQARSEPTAECPARFSSTSFSSSC